MKFEFVEIIPELLENSVVYITVHYNTAVHKCMCGCGNEVVTPISPEDWELNYNGESISLHPSVGNWSFECQSHYWIKECKVIWADKWSNKRIDFNRKLDRVSRKNSKKRDLTKIWKYILSFCNFK